MPNHVQREPNQSSVPLVQAWVASRSQSEQVTLARLWLLPPETARSPATLAEAMLQPAAVERVLEALGPRERAALELVQSLGGVIAAARLEREFGVVRSHGDYSNPRAYLLALNEPASPAERLYLAALVLPIPNAAQRWFAIPPDVLALLPPPAAQAGALELEPLREPVIQSDLPAPFERRVVDMLVLAQAGALEVNAGGALNKASLVRLARSWNYADMRGLSRETQWLFVRFLRLVAQAAGLGRGGNDALLRPTRDALAWMRAAPEQRIAQLLHGWVQGDWDELTDAMQLKLQRAYGRKPAVAKQAVLALLAQVPPDEWFAIEAFVTAVKQADPDFARPDGRYDQWGIVDVAGRSLDGFEHWDVVEGIQVQWMLAGALCWLGLVDIGANHAGQQCFRLSAMGAALLCGTPQPEALPVEPIVVQPTFEVLVPAYASLEARFQIGRVAEHLRNDEVAVYRLSKRSVQSALERGIALDDMLRFLEAHSAAPVPQNVAATLHDWASGHGQITLRRGVLLESRDPILLQQIKRDKRVRAPQVEPLTETAWLVREGDAPQLAERLRKAGYGLAGDVALDAPFSEHDLAVIFAALDFYKRASDSLGAENDVSDALHRRVSGMLSEQQLHRAYRASRATLTYLEEANNRSDEYTEQAE